jgi:signal transduction histidine kinase
MKKQIVWLGVGIELFLLSFFATGYVASLLLENSYSIEFYGLFGMTIFMGFLAYLIVKFKAFDIKLLGAQALIFAQFVLIGAMFFFATSTTNVILLAVTLAGTAIMGWYLIRSVKEEVKRKEELQEMSGKLAEANDKLRKLDNAKSDFISIASHQLRTPITAIRGFLSLLLEGSYGPVSEKQMDVLNKVYVSNDRLINLVEDLLSVSKMESGRMEFKFAKTDLAAVCKEIVDTFYIKAKDNGLYLDFKMPETPLPELMVDAIKVKEVISNFTDNALKYTPKGGVTVRLSQVDGNVRVTVADTGIGIPQSEIPYLFSKFSRGKDVNRLNTGGTGLGLYVGKSIIENNGGKVWAESDGAGLGSRFIIELPIQQNAELLERWG